MRNQSLIILLLAALIALVTGPASAASYKVRKGDSLARIAKKQHIRVEALREANGLESDALKPGMKLVIPAKGKSAKASEGPKAAVVSPTPAKDASAPPVTEWAGYHTVRKGDTFVTIAMTNDLSVDELKRLNPGKEFRKLKPGMRLRVKAALETAIASTEPAEPPETAAAKPQATPETCVVAAGPVYHKVRKGETFASIASKYGVSVKTLKKLNHTRKTKKPKAGSRLLVRRFGAGGTVSADRRRELEGVLQNEASLTAEGAAQPATQVAEMTPDGPIVEEQASPGITGRVIRIAKLMLDLPYRFGGTSLTGIDCSGYVQKVFGFLNLPLPRTAREQFAKGETIEKEELATGDLVFFKTYARFPSHVGIYLGDNKFIHASSGDKKVKIDSLDTPYFLRRYIGARRLITDTKDGEE